MQLCQRSLTLELYMCFVTMKDRQCNIRTCILTHIYPVILLKLFLDSICMGKVEEKNERK